ncbi:MAG: protein subunit release factor B [Verrucomicrobiales bacterium]|jgi:protein subunit release factor B
MISTERQEALQARMDRLGVLEDDLVEKFVLGTGSGGQKINKTHSCVYLKHEPTGIEVKRQDGRSQAANRHYARAAICDAIEGRRDASRLRAVERKEKARRQNRKPSARAKKRMIERKRRRTVTKSNRRSPSKDD